MQLRDFGPGAGVDGGVPADAGEIAFFSEPKAEAPVSGAAVTEPVAASTCDILQSDLRRYYSSRLVVPLSSLLTPAL